MSSEIRNIWYNEMLEDEEEEIDYNELYYRIYPEEEP